MDVDKGRGGDRTCYVCGKWGHMAKNCWERQKKSSRNAAEVGKRKWRTVSSRLASNNVYSVLHPEKLGNKLNSINTTERVRDI